MYISDKLALSHHDLTHLEHLLALLLEQSSKIALVAAYSQLHVQIRIGLVN